MKLLKKSNFTFFHSVFYAICLRKSFYVHISVVICRFEFGMVSKWRTFREWIKVLLYNDLLKPSSPLSILCSLNDASFYPSVCLYFLLSLPCLLACLLASFSPLSLACFLLSLASSPPPCSHLSCPPFFLAFLGFSVSLSLLLSSKLYSDRKSKFHITNQFIKILTNP